MERQIGEVFDFNGVKLEVVEDCLDSECYFRKENVYCGDLKRTTLGYCRSADRKDKKNIIFKKVE